MAKSLRGAPIVGYFKTEKNDFADHGNRVILDDEGIKFECLTKPYGFVSPDAKVWFQEFEDIDDFGNKVVREYLMTTGYLWTGQFEECKSAVEGAGKPQSMEFDSESLDGNWSTNSKTGMDFFIINDATFSKLCILGEDVEPCFEGSKVSAPDISTKFSKVDDDFKKTLYSMMKDLQFALKGGQTMENEVVVTEELTEETAASVEPEVMSEPEVAEEQAVTAEEVVPTGEEPEVTPAVDEVAEEVVAPETDAAAEQFSLLQAENEQLKENLATLQNQFSALEEKCKVLENFKANIEEQEKDAMIARFSMLTDEDKAEVVEHKSQYTVDEIESKLSVICVRKKVNFNLFENNEEKEVNKKVFTYSLPEEDAGNMPAWVQAVKNNKN